MKASETETQQRLIRFLKEHPEYNTYSERRIAALKRKELRAAVRLSKLEEICELRYKNKLTLQAIADKYDITKQRVDQIIKCDVKSL